MTLLAPSKISNEAAGKKHRTSIDWTILAVRIICRWLKRLWVLIDDSGFACIRLGHACVDSGITLVSRLRLDAALYVTAPSLQKGQRGRHRAKGNRMRVVKCLLQKKSQYLAGVSNAVREDMRATLQGWLLPERIITLYNCIDMPALDA